VHNVSDVGHTEGHTAEPLARDLSRLGVDVAATKLKKYKLPVVIKFQQI
jgi:hypothetical protein